ncbi:MAG: hypothetical protein QME51_04890 [Planctomycetota bacterium]|nr:hypothetical protein [Planctomycetota bacterium]MDI6787687.1 hypothetical protein [Planctomycetota bacterium]
MPVHPVRSGLETFTKKDKIYPVRSGLETITKRVSPYHSLLTGQVSPTSNGAGMDTDR